MELLINDDPTDSRKEVRLLIAMSRQVVATVQIGTGFKGQGNFS